MVVRVAGKRTIQRSNVRNVGWMVSLQHVTLSLPIPKQLHYEVHSVSVKGASVNFKSEVLGDVVHAGGGV